jgi:uncharacterized protein DUF4258
MKSDGFLDNVGLRNKILQHIKSGKYRLTKHAAEEQAKDHIDLPDTLHVLKTGVHEIGKTSLSNKYQNWNYAIRGRTEDSKDVRVIISFSDEMMIVTVMEL